MICYLCEEKVSRGPDIVGGHGEWAHIRCVEEAELRRYKQNAQSEIARLRERVRELERQLAPLAARRTVDPHDPDDGEDDVHCPHGGRLIR